MRNFIFCEDLFKMLFCGVCALCFVIKCVSLLEITRAHYGHVEDDTSSSIVYHHVSVSECIRMCAMRPWCKGVGYQQRVQLCFSYLDFIKISTGFHRSKREMVLIDKSDILLPEVGECDVLCSSSNLEQDTCDLNTNTCTKSDCVPLVAELGEDFKGNMNTERSKRAFFCDPEYVQIGGNFGQCLNGKWIRLPICAKTWQSTTEYGGSPDRALDGNPSSIYSRQSCTHTEDETQNFWAVELTRPVKLEGIRIQFRSDCCTDRNTGLTISVFESRVAMESGEGTDCETFLGPPEDSSKPVNITCQEPVIGRVVRVLQQNEEPSPLTLCEVTLIGPGLMQ